MDRERDTGRGRVWANEASLEGHRVVEDAPLLQLLLEDHPPQVARQQHLLVDQRVRRVLGATLGGEGIQLLQHEQQQLPLRVHGLSGQVNEHVPSEQQPLVDVGAAAFTVQDALESSFMASLHDNADEPCAPGPIQFDVELEGSGAGANAQHTTRELKRMMYNECRDHYHQYLSPWPNDRDRGDTIALEAAA